MKNQLEQSTSDDARLARERDIRLAREKANEYRRLADIWEQTLQQLSGEPGAPKTKLKLQDQIDAYLKEQGHAVNVDELVQTLLERKVASDKLRPEREIRESIRYNTTDRRMKGKWKWKIVNGKLGLAEGWDQSKFK